MSIKGQVTQHVQQEMLAMFTLRYINSAIRGYHSTRTFV